MPILGSRGAASVKGFGFAALSSPTYWLATYYANNSGGGIAIDSAGTAYVVGRRTSGSAVDGVLARVTKKGVQIWQRAYAIGASFTATFDDVAVNSTSGNIYVIGDIDYPSSNTNITIVKYNSSGTIQWQRTLDGASTNETPYRIALDSSENVYITGRTPTNLLLVAKYNSSGTIQWQRTLSGGSRAGGDLGGIAVDSSSNVYILGAASSGGEFVIAKYNTSGTIQWQRLLGSGLTATANGLTVDSSANVYICGSYNNSIQIAKYDSSGTIQWQRNLGTSLSGRAIAVDASSNVYIAGSSGSGTPGSYIAKYNSSGTIQWQRSLTNFTFCQGIAVNSSGDSVYVSGTTQPSGTRIFFAKFPGDGSATGTYTLNTYNYTYAVSSLTDAATSLTDAAGSLTDAAGSLTGGTLTLPGSASAMNYALTSL
jgi:hypothetical protein